VGPKLAVAEAAAGILGAMAGDAFEHYLPDVRYLVDVKNADPDGFIAGVARLSAAGLRLPPRRGRPRVATN
jgi:hypothetical protein